ncbi:hypothetical protein N644_1119 [Lactiplantibacillus paraplantarum]|nr:hypothetical protein N644_1119 [Lactiplantibacillus paraplantarum]
MYLNTSVNRYAKQIGKMNAQIGSGLLGVYSATDHGRL